MFITASLFCACTIGLFIGMLFHFSEHIENKVLSVFVSIAIACAVGVILGGLITLDFKGKEERYNNGICTECQGELDLISVNRTKNGTETYYYECEDCGKIVRV